MTRLSFYRQQRSCDKVIFLHVSVILSKGGAGRGLSDNPLDRHPLDKHSPGQTPPTPQGRPLQRTVRILLECILVSILSMKSGHELNLLRQVFTFSTIIKGYNSVASYLFSISYLF